MTIATTPIPDPELIRPFKEAMQRLAATVALVSTHDGAHPFGMAVTAVCSVSAAPPTLLVCINRSAAMHDPVRRSGLFAVNLLGTEHAGLVPIFSGKVSGEERFSHGDWAEGLGRLPILRGAQASLCCRVTAISPIASHSIVVGEVAEVRVGGAARRPLVYEAGHVTKTVALDAAHAHQGGRPLGRGDGAATGGEPDKPAP